MARAQEAGARSSLLAPASQPSEWRLDGVIVRADAAGSALWLQAEVTILQGEASLDGADRARRISVDSETRVWTPDGQTRPFGFNALDQAVRERREVSVVGIWATSPAGPILRARLLVLPDLLPPNWQPKPFGAALRPSRPSSSRHAASTHVARPAIRPRPGAGSPQLDRPPARSSGPNRQAAQAEHATAARQARAREDAARSAAVRAETARATADRAAQKQARAQEDAARAKAAQATAEREAQRIAARAEREAKAQKATQAAARLRAQQQATAQEQAHASAREARAREARAQEAQAAEQQARAQAEARAATARAATARATAAREAARVAQRQARAQEERAHAEEARAAAQRPVLSRAQASTLPDSVAAATRTTPRSTASFPDAPAPRASKPPLLTSSLPSSPASAAPSAPRVASAISQGEGQVAPSARWGVSEPSPSITSRIAPRLQDLPPAAPRDAERERLRAAAPQASRQTVPSNWSEGSPDGPARAPESAAKSLGMRATLPASRARAIITPPLLSSAPFDSASRLAAPTAPQLRRTPLQPPPHAPGAASNILSAQALAPGDTPGDAPGAPGVSADAVQVLAEGEQALSQARANFGALREIQNEVRWLDFCGGPGWDTRGSQLAGLSVAEVGIEEPRAMPRLIALTFDDGPHPNTPRILDILEAHGARGTFFVVGRNVQKHPDILREIARRGHDMGSHSMHHFQGVRLSRADWEREVDGNSQAISAILDQAPRWFRAPGCRYSDEALEVLRSRHLVRVDSSNNSGDWHENDPAKIVSHVLSRLAPGQVILFHDPLPQTATALPILLRELAARGYKCVTLTELARAAAQDPAFVPPLCPPGQGIVLPSSAFTAQRLAAPQVLEAPGDASALPADAPVLLQVQP